MHVNDIFTILCFSQLDGSGLWPKSNMTSASIPSCSVVTIRVVRKSGTALGMSIAGGRGSLPFIGNDEVTTYCYSPDGSTQYRLCLVPNVL